MRWILSLDIRDTKVLLIIDSKVVRYVMKEGRSSLAALYLAGNLRSIQAYIPLASNPADISTR